MGMSLLLKDYRKIDERAILGQIIVKKGG